MAKYNVVVTQCKCHPETCGCGDWSVVSFDSSGMSTHARLMDYNEAMDMADTLNRGTDA